jgi:acetyl-CoA carboxylase biotin carboxyl carrier protein
VAFDVADVRKVLDAFEKSGCNEVFLRSGDFELTIAADGWQPADGVQDVGSPSRVAENLSDNGARTMDGTAVPSGPAVAEPPEPLVPAGETVQVTAPSVGIFWRSPQPGAPPFVEVGDSVTPDTTTCIVEVMKLMNHVKADAAGRVVQVHPRNGDQVSTGEPLFTIEVSG